ncbi:hypothetical protein niasHT_034896 [Heterodera trifolii]|uniref:HAT C-terminal dimerisation domain-containing protein n=1 Tax=Heterodera trifolii TaxID=157864 RepID=A0ABD2I387_9BILA
MLLDPRFAYTELFSQQNWRVVEQQLVEFAKEKLVCPTTEMDANFGVDDFGRVESGIVPTFADQELSPSSSEIEAELACFKAGQRLEMDGDLFSWWNENTGRLPELSKLARMVYSIPATSAIWQNCAPNFDCEGQFGRTFTGTNE